jgi:hypothetical protein
MMLVDFELITQYLLIISGMCIGAIFVLLAQMIWRDYGESKQLFKDIAKAIRKPR